MRRCQTKVREVFDYTNSGLVEPISKKGAHALQECESDSSQGPDFIVKAFYSTLEWNVFHFFCLPENS
jgi:hypothetical protein